jgi:hypothetical protein
VLKRAALLAYLNAYASVTEAKAALAFTGSISDRLRLFLSNSLTHLSHHEQHVAHRPAVER